MANDTISCIHCDSTGASIRKLGVRFMGVDKMMAFECLDCGEKFNLPYQDPNEAMAVLKFVRSDEYIADLVGTKKVFVITSALNNMDANLDFLDALKTYCNHRSAALVIIPLLYKNPSMIAHDVDIWYDSKIEPYLVDNNFELDSNVKVLGGLKLQATVENPLQGVGSLSKGHTIVIGHSQVALQSLPRLHKPYPAIATTTGSITHNNYSNTKLGYRASFHHSYAATVIELDGDVHFVRTIGFDGYGIADLDWYYTKDGVEKNKPIELLYTGDEHAMFADSTVVAATYTDEDSVKAVLKPSIIVRGDVLDMYSGSHHHKNNVFIKYAKNSSGVNKVQDELDKTIAHVVNTGSGCKNILISSNHNDHLTQWLNECNPKEEPWNALLYHQLMYRMLEHTEMTTSGVTYPNPFELYAAPVFKEAGLDVSFPGRRESVKVLDIEVSLHGDKGVNGSKGSAKQFGSLPIKSIVGHSHSVAINKGCVMVGTSSIMNLDYAVGPSNWDSAHAIIHANGKRQLIFIRNGKWRLK